MMAKPTKNYLAKLAPFKPYIPLSLSLVFSLVLVVGLVLPQVRTVSSFFGKKTAAAERIKKISAKAAKLADLLSQRKALEADLNLVDKALPSGEDVPEMMNQVQRVASESGVFLKGLYFGSSARRGKASSSPLTPLKVYLQVEVWGPYANLKAFLENLEGASRIVLVENLKFDLVDTKEGGKTLKTASTLTAFYLEPQEGMSLEAPVELNLSSSKVANTLDKLRKLKTYKLQAELQEESGKLNPFAED